MKNQRIPEHELNFTGDVEKALENTVNTNTYSTNIEKVGGAKQNNSKKDKQSL